mgnify:CR=1 FL=1
MLQKLKFSKNVKNEDVLLNIASGSWSHTTILSEKEIFQLSVAYLGPLPTLKSRIDPLDPRSYLPPGWGIYLPKSKYTIFIILGDYCDMLQPWTL